MREIEGIEDVIRKLEPHWDKIVAHFERENARFIDLLRQDHDVLGRILKCHLIVEHYLDRHLSEKGHLCNLDQARLSFFQKATLLPNAGSAASVVKPGILKLNAIRNRFGHELAPQDVFSDLGAITEVLEVARPRVKFASPVDGIEAFATVACTWLIVPPPNLEKVFQDAFSEVRVNDRVSP